GQASSVRPDVELDRGHAAQSHRVRGATRTCAPRCTTSCRANSTAVRDAGELPAPRTTVPVARLSGDGPEVRWTAVGGSVRFAGESSGALIGSLRTPLARN